jgi:hypothetical protein
MNNKKMKAYSIEDLLVGKFYRSPNSYKSGTIFSAEKRDLLGDGYYLIGYRVDNSLHDKYATVYVGGSN